MASMLMPRCPLIKPHFHYLPATNTVFLRTTLRMESSAAAAASDSASTAQDTESDTVVQYVVLRRDLINTWPLGSVVTQGCHASVAAIWAHKDDPHTLSYCSPPNLDSMHKVTLEVKGETQLLNLSEKLKAGGIAHKLWIEQPENFSTCLATKPYPKSTVSSFFKKLKLCGSSSQRPEGVKKSKAKRKQSEDASILAKSFNESTEKLRETLSFSQAQRELALQLEKEKQQLERERLEVMKKGQEMKQLKREDKILAMDTDAISDPERRNYFRNVQQQILRKRTEEE